VIAAAGPSPLWYLARGSGSVLLVLLTATLVLGVTGALRWRPGMRIPRFVMDGLHRNLALVGVSFLAAHVTTAVLDPFAQIGLVSAVVPLSSNYRPLWVGLGAVALDLLIALVVTSLVRRRLGLRAWRAVHWTAYACWPVAVLHGLGTGTDARSGWFQLLAVACVLAALVAVATRAAREWPQRPALSAGALGLVAASLVGGMAFALSGPLAPGWARRAGTPDTLLASVRPVARVTVARRDLPLPFSGTLEGTIQRSGGEESARVDIAATVTGLSRPARVEVRIDGRPVFGGGLAMTASAVSLGTSDQPDLYAGRIVSLQGADIVARLHRPGARPLTLRLALQLAADSAEVTGSADAREIA